MKLEQLLKDKDWTLEEAKSMYETCKELVVKTENKNSRNELIFTLNYCYQLINNEIIGYDQDNNVITRYDVQLLNQKKDN